MSDNYHFDITGGPLEIALQVAFFDHKKTVGWKELEIGEKSSPSAVWGANQATKRLVLFWYAGDSGCNLFPSPIGCEDAVSIVKSWLATADYGKSPDHDGDNGKTQRVYNEAWGHVADERGAFVAIEPVWSLYGK